MQEQESFNDLHRHWKRIKETRGEREPSAEDFRMALVALWRLQERNYMNPAWDSAIIVLLRELNALDPAGDERE